MVQTLQPTQLVLVVLFPSLSTVAIGLRVYVRCSSRLFYWDDGLAVLAWCMAVGEAAMLYMYIVSTWQGYHYYDVPTDMTTAQHVRASQYDIANQLLYFPLLAVVKASIILFLARLEDNRKSIRWALKTFFVLNLLIAISIFTADLCQCRPVNYYWDHWWMDTYDADGNVTQAGGSCFKPIPFILASASLSILTDILITVIPIFMVWNLRMTKRNKIATWAVLSMGWIVAIVGTIRMVLYYFRFQPDNIDRSYSVTITTSVIEVNIAIIASCGPSLKAFTTRFIPNLFGTQNRSRTGGSHVYCNGFSQSDKGGSNAYSRHAQLSSTKDNRPEDAQYGMHDLDPPGRDDNSDEVVMVRADDMKANWDNFQFGLAGGISHMEPGRVYHRASL